MIITVGRQVGSGGRIVGQKLAERLNLKFYDREILQRAARESGIGDEFFEHTDENNSWFARLKSYLNITAAPHDNYLSAESLFKFQSDTIRHAADEGGCVFVGRCADYILRDRTDRVDVFISANMEDRVKRAAEYFNITPEEAKKRIHELEQARRKYYNYFTEKEWGVAESYHICLNSSNVGIDACVGMIIGYINSLKR
ncbi:MAG: cytidylate kinase-like family protein [Bacteroidales bacterium]|jgi:cytidylate kinase|nr:cytidylate kinase-like family protein [Bacteroidales bacterium]